MCLLIVLWAHVGYAISYWKVSELLESGTRIKLSLTFIKVSGHNLFHLTELEVCQVNMGVMHHTS